MRAAIKDYVVRSRGGTSLHAHAQRSDSAKSTTAPSDSNILRANTADDLALGTRSESQVSLSVSRRPGSPSSSATNMQTKALDSSIFMQDIDPDLLEKFGGRFRILIIGRANSGKTTILQQICNSSEYPEVYNEKGEKRDFVIEGTRERGFHDINDEIVFKSNRKFIFHDSPGFEAGDMDEFEKIRNFIAERTNTISLGKRIHVIWYCISMDHFHRAITASEEKFFNECDTSKVPVMVLFTKCDLLMAHVFRFEDLLLPPDEQFMVQKKRAEEMFTERNMQGDFSKIRFPPQAYVQLENMDKSDAGCYILLEQTATVLSHAGAQIVPLCAQEDSNGKIVRLEETIQQLHVQLSDHQQTIDNLRETLRVQEMDSNTKIANLEESVQQLHAELTHSQQSTDSLVQILLAHERKYDCEALYAEGRIIDATVALLETINIVNESDEVRANSLITDWLTKFKSQLISTLEECGDEASSTRKQEEAFAAYSAVLSLGPPISNTLLMKWARVVLIRSSATEALSSAAQFGLPSFLIYRTICDVLDENGRALEAIEYFRRMQSELGSDTKSVDETEWVTTFKARCLRTLEQCGDVAMDSTSYKDAIVRYTAALTLNPSSTDLLTKRSRARAGIGSWGDSLEDAGAAIRLDPSSPRGYERRHAALLGAQRYDEAIDAFKDMLVRFERSSDPATRESRNNYVSPSQTIAAIRGHVKRVQRDAPPILINTGTGRLYSKQERMDEFEADLKFKELVASITTKRDNSRITETVQQYFRYATFSHTWEGIEPLFHDVLHESVHQMAASSSSKFLKLVMFCRTVQEAGLHWAWSDTCCINKMDGPVLQESLTSMFQWYHNSALTIVHLKGVLSDSELGALIRSLWNTRGWTLQEFFASRVIRFYTEDWKPYLPHETMDNHKHSSVIMGEMATATGVDAQVLLSLRPGSDNVRQKLCLAAKRTTTKQEDMAYSLFGIFDVSTFVTYGEGQQHALGRLLQEVLTRSGDVTILAWTGKASDYNSCLPAEIDVYREPASPCIPLPVGDDKMDLLVTELRTSFPGYLESAGVLYDRVVALPSPRLFSRRLSLSCIIFPLRGPLTLSDDSQDVYRTRVYAFGNIEIKTMNDLSSFDNLVLVHPWIRCFLDPSHSLDDLVDDNAESPVSPTWDGGDGDPQSLPPSHAASPTFDRLTRALRLFVRLRQPFGALLLAPVPLTHNEYKRVASDHPIAVQLLEEVSPRHLAQRIRTLDIL